MQDAAFEIGNGACRAASAFTGSSLCPLQADAVLVGYVVFGSLAILGVWTLMRRFNRA